MSNITQFIRRVVSTVRLQNKTLFCYSYITVLYMITIYTSHGALKSVAVSLRYLFQVPIKYSRRSHYSCLNFKLAYLIFYTFNMGYSWFCVCVCAHLDEVRQQEGHVLNSSTLHTRLYVFLVFVTRMKVVNFETDIP